MAKPRPARVKSAAAAHPVPQSRDQVVAAIAEIGRLSRERLRLEAGMNDELAAVKERFEEAAAPLSEQLAALQAGVQTWCEANRDALTQGGKTKTAVLGSGEVRWRLTPPAVRVKRGMVDAVIAELNAAGLGRFVRLIEELNKDAILAEPDAVRGVAGLTIVQTEEFMVVPFEAALQGETAS